MKTQNAKYGNGCKLRPARLSFMMSRPEAVGGMRERSEEKKLIHSSPLHAILPLLFF